MKPLLITLLLISSVAYAKPVKHAKPEPAPVAVEPGAAPTITRDEIVETLEHMRAIVATQTKELDDAKNELATSQSSLKASDAHLLSAQGESAALQRQITVLTAWGNDQEKQKQEALAQLAIEHKARVAADAHVSLLKEHLGFALGVLLFLLVQHIPWSLVPPPPWNLYGRIAGSAAAFGLGWFIVARFT